VLKVDAPMVSDTVVRRLTQTANQLHLKPKVVAG